MSQLASMAREAMKAVVQIHAQGFDEQDLQSILDPRYNVPMSWTGSGFFIRWGQEEGLILTNSHVVRNAVKVHIKTLLTSEETFRAQIVGLVPSHEPDLALIRLDSKELLRFKEISAQQVPYLDLEKDMELCRGLELKAIGYPFGLPEPNMSGGEVTNFLSSSQAQCERLVTDAAINPGNSGGPSLVESGVVIGVNTSIIVNSNNMGFITPIHYARILIPQFLESKSTELSSLGARFQVNSPSNTQYLGNPLVEGVIITHVHKGGALEKAGVQRFDVLVAINGFQFDRYGNIKERVGNHKINIFDVVKSLPLEKEIKLQVMRKGELLDVDMITTPMPETGLISKPIIQERRFIQLGGALIQELSQEILFALSDVLEMDYKEKIQKYKLPIVVITYMDLDSESEELQFIPGDVITHVNGQEVSSLEEMLKKSNALFDQGVRELLLEDSKGAFGVFKLESPLKLESAPEYFMVKP